MISKTNSSPSFGMAFRQERMLDILSPLKESALKSFSNNAGMINKYSNKHNVDVFMKGIQTLEEAAEGVAEDAEPIAREAIDKIVVTLQGKSAATAEGEEAAEILSRTFEYDADKILKSRGKIRDFFKGLKGEITKTGILTSIKNNFGI